MKTFRIEHDIYGDDGSSHTVEAFIHATTEDEARYYALEMIHDKFSPLSFKCGYHISEIACEDCTKDVTAFNTLLGDLAIDL